MVLLQQELGAAAPSIGQPIYSAGTVESRNATLSIPTLNKPTAWIDVYYPVLNTPLNHSVEILNEHGDAVWSAPLEEEADETDPDADVAVGGGGDAVVLQRRRVRDLVDRADVFFDAPFCSSSRRT